jgi:hypothetical protein
VFAAYARLFEGYLHRYLGQWCGWELLSLTEDAGSPSK